MTRPRPAWTPPAREGVNASRLALASGPWATVAEFLAARLRAGIDWHARMAQGDVLDAQGRPLAADAPCVPGAVVWYWRSLPPEPRVPFELTLLHHDEHLVVVDKPHFLAAIPGGRYLQETVLVRLKRLLGNHDLTPLHRLDRETAGVLLFSALPATRNAHHALLRERRVHKVYEAVAPWRGDLALPLTALHRLQDPPGARHLPVQVVAGEANAQTQVELLRRLGRRKNSGGPARVMARVMAGEREQERGQELGPQTAQTGAQTGAHEAAQDAAQDAAHKAARNAVSEPAQELAHYRLTPLTGRRHQLRAQLNALGLPIVGDRIYPRLWPEAAPDAPPDYTQPLQLLAREIAFTCPISGTPRRFVSARQLALAE